MGKVPGDEAKWQVGLYSAGGGEPCTVNERMHHVAHGREEWYDVTQGLE